MGMDQRRQRGVTVFPTRGQVDDGGDLATIPGGIGYPALFADLLAIYPGAFAAQRGDLLAIDQDLVAGGRACAVGGEQYARKVVVVTADGDVLAR